ncbi:hypothetical protein [Paludisphaera rhizosphaerae]|uniref:hypothetical protein n=1 Tax=Paludisphaera rhizosphaerae TaxID=2711216 RepID=UPI0013EACCD3|nr:hypothetical protein [Paludisphaera rhizosphaerae]
MERRELLTLLGAGAAGFLATGSSARGDDDDKKKAEHEHLMTMARCATICNMVSAHCLAEIQKGGSENGATLAKVAAYTNDCQSFCTQTAALMARKSPMANYAHKACADACRDCAEVCDSSNNEHIKKCAEVCRECERACRACCSA